MIFKCITWFGLLNAAVAVKVSTSSFNVYHGSRSVPTPFDQDPHYSFNHIPTPGPRYLPLTRTLPSHVVNSLTGVRESLRPSFARIAMPKGVSTCGAAPVRCQKEPYRTFDGSCNNLDNPALGIANSRYGRLLSPKYGDGISSPTLASSGNPLPGSRLVSLVVFGEEDVPDPDYTLINMQWGQMMTHDMSLAAGTTQTQKHPHNCCTNDGKLIPKNMVHSRCYPIITPRNDPAHSQTGTQCMNFVRTLTDLEAGCPRANDYEPAEQITAVTHYMDLSLVYGNSVEQNNQLRTFQGGRMRVDERDGHEWLPQTRNGTNTCEIENEYEICYEAGDNRVNQNPGLTILHTVLVREHNRIADELSHWNPHADDELLFQEARKINIAEFQHISYYEWLPIFLGYENMLKNRIIYKGSTSYVNDYDPSIDPSTLNSHSTAAFRYFHSQIEGRLDLVSELRSITGALRLSDWFNKPGIIETNDNYDSLIRGHATQPEELTDINFDREIKEFLFRGNMPFGSDLRAIDIQRNRDHGLASYNDYREFCGLKRAHSWEDFFDFISPEIVNRLKSIYESFEDVDLTVAGSLERHVQGALAGPTFLCILTEQFYRTRVGDRFFYENGYALTGFTRKQLSEIRKTSMARLICDNGNDIDSVQPSAFRTISKSNPVIPCYNIPKVDLSKWTLAGQHELDRYGQQAEPIGSPYKCEWC